MLELINVSVQIQKGLTVIRSALSVWQGTL